ncbi:PREDICTED: uncharacterized protein LOC108756645 isoform X1 [Trachymyrmex septentrionalis]|nr:PREDICTED: uncharacterized protein LOC108756645 isoform X1 [Trachymyrmex septentrionalis]XP_018356124.1 PREDICTED: uncharacterized protein LOC108756645 isoform X1 [Trachymyrmex septentrionalis]XP_018356125.1 PREDICTED: uncharacterized protein LOC108756645 isoform X1 [Trachymyrmex septentrionalis]XP_018356126.1 PREDICTED: uncharacterized protein LOC108756645 isoform X1 [Trachymyrmex septentrionalis]XP_018356127.1 PREDICTED: uncharacterized protein LOC108756645 isoform X1 [Trachymyrmex septent
MEDFRKNEIDYRECRNVEEDRASSYNSLLSNRNDHEYQDFNITDPLLAHELFLPYNCMPRPRLFCANDEDAECAETAIVLPKRFPSPIRHILPGRFDLHSTKELLKRRSITKARRYLWEFKDRILQSAKQVSNVDIDLDSVICTLVLHAMCENVILTMAGTNTFGIDAQTFINMAINWILVHLQILDPSMLSEQERIMFTEFELSDIDERSTSHEVVASSKLRRTLFEVHRPKFDPHDSIHLHRSLPWTLVSPAHQTGVIKFYPNVRKRIEEKLPDSSQYVKSIYIPDVTCSHF